VTVHQLDPEIRGLVEAWRFHRRAARKLAMQLDGWESVAAYLNSELTMADLAEDCRLLGPEFTRDLIEYAQTLLPSGDC
jgi:hypothetical protein